MDIQVSSNFERALFDACGRDGDAVARLMDDLKRNGGFQIGPGALQALRGRFESDRVSEDETRATIRDVHRRSAQILCPHSAVAACVARRRLGATPMITLATAHPAKFPAAVRAACGRDVPLPPRLADLHDRPERMSEVANDLGALKSLIEERLSR